MKNIINKEEEKSDNSLNAEKKYIDMTQEELNHAVQEHEDFIKNTLTNLNNYTINDIKKLKDIIEKENKSIAEKKQEYLNSIKSYEKRKKDTMQELKEKEKELSVENKFKENQNFILKTIKDIKENLKLNPNYYKN